MGSFCAAAFATTLNHDGIDSFHILDIKCRSTVDEFSDDFYAVDIAHTIQQSLQYQQVFLCFMPGWPSMILEASHEVNNLRGLRQRSEEHTSELQSRENL